MLRLSSALLCAVLVLTSACHKNTAEEPEPEPAGTLEGLWIVGMTDIVDYDAQNNVLVAYQPVGDIHGFSQINITSNTLQEYHVRTYFRDTIAYVRTGDELRCPPPANSYTIRKLTIRNMDLYHRGEYTRIGSTVYRSDFTMHLHRP